MVLRRLLIALAAVLVTACGATGGGPSMSVGAPSDPEDALLAHIYAAGLRYYGTAARVDASGDVLEALDGGKVSVAPGFTGRLLQRLDPESEARSAEQVYRALAGALPEGLAAADYAVAAEDKPALAVTDAIATGWGGRDLATLVRHCAALRVGAISGSEPRARSDPARYPRHGNTATGQHFSAHCAPARSTRPGPPPRRRRCPTGSSSSPTASLRWCLPRTWSRCSGATNSTPCNCGRSTR